VCLCWVGLTCLWDLGHCDCACNLPMEHLLLCCVALQLFKTDTCNAMRQVVDNLKLAPKPECLPCLMPVGGTTW
jgi:hypothetical protein